MSKKRIFCKKALRVNGLISLLDHPTLHLFHKSQPCARDSPLSLLSNSMALLAWNIFSLNSSPIPHWAIEDFTYGRRRHLGCGANTVKFTVNIWEKSWFWCSITLGWHSTISMNYKLKNTTWEVIDQIWELYSYKESRKFKMVLWSKNHFLFFFRFWKRIR